ncbi:serine--tRNA ligase [Ureaplasma ceti]|uniref:Serine--tRNA ligase n=1 Tax=Ureaplasma ceti TaxID=3119530 RepID=A0ABP9U7G0_9BACT
MFSIDLIRNKPEYVKEKLGHRHFDTKAIDEIIKLDEQNRLIKTDLQQINAKRNQMSKEIGLLMGQGKKEEALKIQAEVAELKTQISDLTTSQSSLEKDLMYKLACVPNICDDSVPVGKDENDNVPQHYFSEPTKFGFEPLAHWDLAVNNKLIDFDRATKISGARFIVYRNLGARLMRALQQFTLDHNVKYGFTEILPPTIINANSLYGSGQLPKFKEDVYVLENDGESMYLSPTAEVQLVNLHRDEIIDAKELPIRYTANTPCYRSEAGSAGRDTRGVIRQHQFWKSELVEFTKAEDSWTEHEKLTRCAELVLEELGLPYRRLLLCTGDTGFSSAKTYDLEVWLPSYNEYKEISSCSNCLDFQARRAAIRTRNEEDKTVLVHTLNGSSLAIDRLWAAVVENYQQADGSIKVPEALIPYMGGLTEIR